MTNKFNEWIYNNLFVIDVIIIPIVVTVILTPFFVFFIDPFLYSIIK